MTNKLWLCKLNRRYNPHNLDTLLKNKQQGTLTTSTEQVDKQKTASHSILETFMMMKLDLLIKKQIK